MNRYVTLLCAGLLLYAGCASTPNLVDTEAARHLASAEEYVRSGEIRKAEDEYLFVIAQLTHSTLYPRALRQYAMLALDFSNPARNDSAAIARLRTYLPHVPSPDEREHVTLHIRLLEHGLTLEGELAEQAMQLEILKLRGDSLAIKLETREKRLQRVEAELKQVSTELTRLREVDIRLHQRKK